MHGSCCFWEALAFVSRPAPRCFHPCTRKEAEKSPDRMGCWDLGGPREVAFSRRFGGADRRSETAERPKPPPPHGRLRRRYSSNVCARVFFPLPMLLALRLCQTFRVRRAFAFRDGPVTVAPSDPSRVHHHFITFFTGRVFSLSRHKSACPSQ